MSSRLATVLAFFLLLSSVAEAATFNVSGTTLAINLTAANETVAITAGATNYTFDLTGGTWSGTDSSNVTGNGTASLSAVKTSFTAVTVDDGSTGNSANFSDSGLNPYTSNFTLTLDDATAGAITFNGNTLFTGSAALNATGGTITVVARSVVSTNGGNVTLAAPSGVTVNGLVNSGAGVLAINADPAASGTGTLTVDASGSLYGATLDLRAASVSIASTATVGSATGGLITAPTFTFTGLGNPYALAIDGSGNLCVANLGNSTVSKFAPGATTPSATLTGLAGPRELAFDGSGNLYVSNYNPSTVSKFAPGATTPSATLTGLSGPLALAFDGSGNLYVSNPVTGSGTTVSKFAPGATTPSATLTGLTNPQALAFDGSGNLFVANTYANTVSQFAPGATTASATLTGVSSPQALAFDGSGNLYVANSGVHTVSKFAPGAATPTATLTGLGSPRALAFDGSGNLYVVNSSVHTVSKFAPGATTPSATLTGLNYPSDLAFDGSGNLYVANYGGNSVSQFAPGTTTSATTSVTFRQSASGQAINLGTDAAGVLGLTTTELGRVFIAPTGTLNIGDANSGAITISAVISVAGYNTLAIKNGAAFSATGGFYATVTSASVYQQMQVNGALVIDPSATLIVTATGGFVPAAGDSFSIIANTSASTTTGAFRGKPEGLYTTLGGVYKRLTYSGGTNGNNVVLAPSPILVLNPQGTVIVPGGSTSFAPAAVGASTVLTFTVSNPSAASLTGLNITFSGTHAGEFSVLTAPPGTIPPGGSATFTIRFTPASTGAKTATLNLASSALGVPSFAINLSGSGATVLTVTTLSDNFTTPVAGSLREAINTANADPANGYLINFNVAGGGTLALAADTTGARMLPILTNPSGINIDGANGGQGAITIDGGATSDTTGDRIFFIGVPAGTPKAGGGTMTDTAATSYSISNLRLQNGNARGGAGGASGGGGGGGGAGLGGAIFVNAGNLSLSGVTLAGNRAIGGAGGAKTGSGAVGGGGGMGGTGAGPNNNGAGGGGFGIGAKGGILNIGSTRAVAGQFTGGANGGSSITAAGGTAPGGANGGGGGGFGTPGGGGGGVGGGNGSILGTVTSGVIRGGVGGFGGGGGGGREHGGAGGYGGGGGANNTFGSPTPGGSGGFGGGGGAGLGVTNPSGFFGASIGGFGGGRGGSKGGGGGGGLGAGGAIFVRQGATLTLTDGGLSGGAVVAGAGGAGTGLGSAPTPGEAIGSGVFLAGSASYSVSAGSTVTVADSLGGGAAFGGNFIITSATQSGTTVTITTTTNHDYKVNQQVTIAGVDVAGYNGTFALTAVTANTFTYTTTAGLTASSGGTTSTLDGINSSCTKTGPGMLALSGTNSYTGGTIINGGVLQVNETITANMSATGVGPVTVNNGGTLAGGNSGGTTGSVLGSVTVNNGGSIAPGSSGPGILTVNGNIAFSSGSTLSLDLNGATAGSDYDQLKVNGTVDLGGATLTLAVGFVPTPGQTFKVVDNDGSDAITGTFAGLSEDGSVTLGGARYVVSYVGGDGNDVVLTAANDAPDIAVTQTSAVADGGSVDFGTVTLGSSSAAKTFTITNPGMADLTSLAITGATSEFTVTALSGTSIPVGSGSVTFSVTFTPSASGARTATLQIASNVVGAKNPYDIVLNGTGSVPAPTVTTISPNTGSTLGGTPVTITGTNFISGATVTIGGAPATGVTVVDATTITATTPAGDAGNASVVVTTSGGANAANSLYSFVVPNTAPTDITITSTSIAENNALGATVGELTATDANVADTHAFTFATGGTDNAAFTLSGSTLSLNASADFEAKSSYSIRIRATDSGVGSLFFEKDIMVTIINVNEKPAFTKGANQSVLFGTATAQSVPGWATMIDDGDSTVEQALIFNVSVISGGTIFTDEPGISSDGTLTYTPNGKPGTAMLSVTLTDDAAVNGNAALTAGPQMFTITIETSKNANLKALISSQGKLTPAFQEDIKDYSLGLPFGTSSVTISPTVAQPDATVTVNGQAVDAGSESSAILLSTGTTAITVVVTAQDGTTQQTYRVAVVITSPPTVADVTASTLEDQTMDFTVASFEAGYTPSSAELTLNSIRIVTLPSQGTLKLGTTTVKAGQSIPRLEISTLTYVPDANVNGTDSFTWKASDLNNESQTEATLKLTIKPVNDAPSFVKGSDPSVNEDSGTTTISGWATDILAGGGTDEATQVLTFTIVGNTQPALFRTAPVVNSLGELTFTIEPLTFGSAMLTIKLSDDGGTENGGVDQSGEQTFSITVEHVNHPPAVVGTGVPTQVVNVGGGALNLDLASYFVDVDLADTVSYSLQQNSNPASAGASITGRSLTLTPLTAGSTYVTVLATDDHATPASVEHTFLVIVGTATPTLGITTSLRLNRSNGLLEQVVSITNTMGRTINGFRLQVTNLPAKYQLWNRTHVKLPVIEHKASLAANAVLRLTLQFYTPTRSFGTYRPSFTVQELEHFKPDYSDGLGALPLSVRVLPDNGVVLLFAARTAWRYQVEYSDGGGTWHLSPVAFKAGATKVQWIDRGPPYTLSEPALPLIRQYRLRVAR